MSYSSTPQTFVGFSTVGAERTGNTRLSDIALIKQDLMNAFMTRIGERVMRPDYGCRIWEWFMEPLTPGLRDMITQEAVRICETDSRVEVLDVQVYQLDQGVRVDITLRFRPFDVIDTFSASFEDRQISEGNV